MNRASWVARSLPMILLLLAQSFPQSAFADTSYILSTQVKKPISPLQLDALRILTIPDTRALNESSVNQLNLDALDFMNWSIAPEGSDNQFDGGVIAGGGDILPRVEPDPSILLDFWFFDENFRDQWPNENEKILFPQTGNAEALFHGMPLNMDHAVPETMALLRARLELWRADSPLVIGLLESALKKPNFRVTAIPFHCNGRGSPNPDGKQNYPNIIRQPHAISGACFFAHRGIYLHDYRFNSLGKLSRAGILAHELFRKIQSDLDLGFADARLLTAVNLLMRKTPVAGAGKLNELIFQDPWRPVQFDQDGLDNLAGVFCTTPTTGDLSYEVSPKKIAIQIEAHRRTIMASKKLPATSSVSLNRANICAALDDRRVIPAKRCLEHEPETWTSEEIKGAFDTAKTGMRLWHQHENLLRSTKAPLWISVSPQLQNFIVNKKVLKNLTNRLSSAVNAGACHRTYTAHSQRGPFLWVRGDREFARAQVILNTVFLHEHKIDETWDTSWSRNSLRWPQVDMILEDRFGHLWPQYEDVWAADRLHYLDVTTERRLQRIQNAVRDSLKR